MTGRLSFLALAAILLAGCDDSFRFDAADGGDDAGVTLDVEAPDVDVPEVTPPTACTDDTSCPLPTLHCDLASGTCVACVIDDQCAGMIGRPRCDTALHRCVECGSNQDCGSNAVCEPSTHLCVGVCTEDYQCLGTSTHCNEILKRCYECTGNSECTNAVGRPRCELLTGRCVGCTNSTNCSGATPRCDVATFTCVGCVSGSDCASGVCDPSTRTCVN